MLVRVQSQRVHLLQIHIGNCDPNFLEINFSNADQLRHKIEAIEDRFQDNK